MISTDHNEQYELSDEMKKKVFRGFQILVANPNSTVISKASLVFVLGIQYIRS